MCFVYDDCDWYATTVEEEMRVHLIPTYNLSWGALPCCECRKRNILNGDTYEWVRMLEENDDYSGEEDIDEHGPEYLQDEVTTTCFACYSYREAVRVVELREGCREKHARPGYGDLFESTRNSDHYQEYWEECIKLNPWMKDVRYKYYEDKDIEDFYAKRWWVQCVVDTKYFV